MSLRAYQPINIQGVAQTGAVVTASDTMPPNERGFWEVANASGGNCTVTVVVPGSMYGQARPDVATVVADGTTRRFGPLVGDLADPATGLITITHSATSSVTGTLISI